MDIEINWLAVALATVAGIIVGRIWYEPKLFTGALWTKLTGVEKGNKPTIVVFVVSNFITALLFAVTVSIVAAYFNNDSLWLALVVGFVAWLGFSVTTLAPHNGFELKPVKLTVLNSVYQLVLFLAMTLVIGLL
jgi:uncharacterized membrane protein YagU involved in acid resistance